MSNKRGLVSVLPRSGNTKRRQHYVWKKYLNSWATNGRVWTIRTGDAKPFCTDPINVAVERDFYKLHGLTKEDEQLIRKIALDSIQDPILKKLNEGWLSQFSLLFAAEALIRPREDQVTGAKELLDTMLLTIEEDGHAQLENTAGKCLDLLLQGHTGFYETAEGATDFSYFISHQYLRTKRMQDGVFASMARLGMPKQQCKRIWPILRHIFATSISYSIFIRRGTMKLILLNCTPGMEFITCDQPVLNTYAGWKLDSPAPTEVELYYPISPTQAVLLTDKPPSLEVGEPLSSFMTEQYNQFIERAAHGFVFAKSEQSLDNIRLRPP